ncbi:alkylhydroperoxidase AhpD family core domain protein [compost metagenome]
MGNMQDWNSYRNALLDGIGDFAKINKDAIRGYQTLEQSAGKTANLDPKTHELIALAVAVTTRCDGCIAVHAKKAADLGVSREEIAEALGTAIALNAGAALTYSARALDAFESVPKN